MHFLNLLNFSVLPVYKEFLSVNRIKKEEVNFFSTFYQPVIIINLSFNGKWLLKAVKLSSLSKGGVRIRPPGVGGRILTPLVFVASIKLSTRESRLTDDITYLRETLSENVTLAIGSWRLSFLTFFRQWLLVFRNFRPAVQFVSTRPISKYPTSFRKNEEILKVYGNFHLFKMALSIIRLFTREWHVL